MADITWRQMAGPNFAGTAAAMDAGADRIGAATDLFSRVAGDQVKLQQQQQAKLKADNTARALAELSSFKTVDELNAAAPRLNFDALIGQYGKNIDAGAVTQQAALQKGIIEQNQLRSVDLANKTREAQEAPILGQAKEQISSLISQGKFDEATKLADQLAPQITDASGLYGLVDQGRAAFTERQLASDRNARENTRAAQDTTLFGQNQTKYLASEQADADLMAQVENVGLGHQDSLVFKPIKGMDINQYTNNFTKAQLTLLSQSDLPSQVKEKLTTDIAKNTREKDMVSGMGQSILKKVQEQLPTAHPAVSQFYNTLSPDAKTKIKSVTTPEGALLETLKLSNPNFAPDSWEDLFDTGTDTLNEVLVDKGVDLNDYDPEVIAAAAQGISVNNDNKLSGKNINLIVKRIKDYSEKQGEYKKNANELYLTEQVVKGIDNTLLGKYAELQDLDRLIALEGRKDELGDLYSNFTGRAATTSREKSDRNLLEERKAVEQYITDLKKSMQDLSASEFARISEKLKQIETDKLKK